MRKRSFSGAKTRTTKVIKKKVTPKGKSEFERYLEKIEDPRNNREVNYGLPKNPTSTQIVKYKLCKKILAFQQDHSLTDEEIAEQIGFGLSPAEVEDILW